MIVKEVLALAGGRARARSVRAAPGERRGPPAARARGPPARAARAPAAPRRATHR